MKEAVPTVSRIAALLNPTVSIPIPKIVLFKKPSALRGKPASRFFFFYAPTMIRFRPSRK